MEQNTSDKAHSLHVDRPMIVKIISILICVAMLAGFPIAANSEQVKLAQHTHEMSETIVTEEPGCEAVGAGHKECLYEGCTYQEPVEIEALGHQTDSLYCKRCYSYFSPEVDGLCETDKGIFLVKDSKVQTEVTSHYTDEAGELWYVKEGTAYDYYCGDIDFTWPTPTCGIITSYFGYRDAPTAGASSAHKGMDIGAMHGTKIVSVASGTVVESGYNQWNGNYLFVSHGEGLKSVYLHCSEVYAQTGDQVEAGEEVAAVGSTGVSTGAHLHFGIYLNEVPVNPLFYISY